MKLNGCTDQKILIQKEKGLAHIHLNYRRKWGTNGWVILSTKIGIIALVLLLCFFFCAQHQSECTTSKGKVSAPSTGTWHMKFHYHVCLLHIGWSWAYFEMNDKCHFVVFLQLLIPVRLVMEDAVTSACWQLFTPKVLHADVLMEWIFLLMAKHALERKPRGSQPLQLPLLHMNQQQPPPKVLKPHRKQLQLVPNYNCLQPQRKWENHQQDLIMLC